MYAWENWPESKHCEILRDGQIYNTKTNQFLKPYLSQGYYRLHLHHSCVKNVALHRVVAFRFHGPPPTPAHTVNHINGIKTDNRCENLEWSTPAQQSLHASRLGLMVNSSRAIGQYHRDELIQTFPSVQLAATSLGLESGSLLSRACKYSTTAYGFQWHYLTVEPDHQMSPADEIWENITWQDQTLSHKISNYGRVQNKRGKICASNNTGVDFAAVNIYIRPHQKAYLTVHRLVALAFIPNPDQKTRVSHVNGDKSNNHVSNLVWT